MKNLQLVLYEALLKTVMPADAGEFVKYLLQVVSYDPIDISDNISETCDLNEDAEPFSINFEAMGLESFYQIVNAGTLNIILAMGPFFLLLIWFLPKCTQKFPKAHTYFRNLKDRTFFNGILRFLDAIFLPVLI